MFRVRKIKFEKHPFLGDLSLDFTGPNGNAVDTVIIAGENGVGKSTILDSMYGFFSMNPVCDMTAEIELDSKLIRMRIWRESTHGFYSQAFDEEGKKILGPQNSFSAIFSDVEINFVARDINAVTSMSLDAEAKSRKSNSTLPTTINQLLVDIEAQDAALIAESVKRNPDIAYKNMAIAEKMSRFKNAFSVIFDDLEYSNVENINGKKVVFFKKNDDKVSIDKLSSGEKEIVYRGCFLLKDINALNDPAVFIDEPEISLHPEWQKKIMDYYKAMFTDEKGVQTSQIFVATHSPFIIHNDRRYNDKVIVLSRTVEGKVEILDKPDYYSCNSKEVIRDAFNVVNENIDEPTVYLEGRTDEMYFNRALEVFKINSPYRFKWIGYLDSNGQEVNTGENSLDKAAHFMVAKDLPVKNVFLFDCDTRKEDKDKNNVYWRSIKQYENVRKMNKGIENALDLSSVDLTEFIQYKDKEGDYGVTNRIGEFKKMDFCKYICGLGDEELKKIFKNLKDIIDEINSI